eukprot:1440701-Alexandrium_andersonii.AAC.1
MHAGSHLRAQDDAERRALRDAVMRVPGAEGRQAVLERGHEVPIEISDDEDAPEAERGMWPAQRRVAQDESSSD